MAARMDNPLVPSLGAIAEELMAPHRVPPYAQKPRRRSGTTRIGTE